MSVDATTPRSRRALLSAAAATAAATAAVIVSRPLDAMADTGDPLVLGQVNVAADTTSLDGRLSFQAQNAPTAGEFVTVTVTNQGDSRGTAALIGYGGGGTGIGGVTDGGYAGVSGVSNHSLGFGVVASNPQGFGLDVIGKVRIQNRSGRVTVQTGRKSVDVDLREKGGVASLSPCFATVMSYRPGVFVTMVRPNYPIVGKMRIYLNKTVRSKTYVSWLVLN